MVAGIEGLTSFGSLMYTLAQLKTLKSNLGEQGERIEFLSHQIQEQDLWIYNITQVTKRYVENSVEAIGKVVEETKRLTIVKALESSMRTYLLNFKDSRDRPDHWDYVAHGRKVVTPARRPTQTQ